MKLLFEDITKTPHCYSIAESTWFPAIEDCSLETATATLWVTRQDSETVSIKGEIQARYTIVCDRCGELYKDSLQSEFVYQATIKSENSPELVDQELREEDLFELYLPEPVIDVEQILREQALLTMPLKNLCKEDCKGICAGCGNVLNRQPCCCNKDTSNSPFAVLKKFKK